MPSEEDVIDAVIECMKLRKNALVNNMEYPDRENRSGKEVDRRFQLDGSKVVLEHSQTESFLGQIPTGKRWKQVFDELDRRLSGKLPTDSRFNFYADTSVMNFKNRKEQIKAIDILEEWILKNATKLKIHTGGTARRLNESSFIKETPPGLNFEASLVRMTTGSFAGKLIPAQGIDEDLQRQREVRIAQLLKNKLPKLASAKARESANLSVLVIESNDIGLGNSVEISVALQAAINQVSADLPDEIYLIETEIQNSWWIWVLQENGSWAVRNDGYLSYRYENAKCMEN